MANQRGASFTFRRCNVFSTFKGDTPHAPPEKKYWFVEARENGGLTIQPVDELLWLPVGTPRPFNARELQSGNYKPEPEIYAQYVSPMLENPEVPSSESAASEPLDYGDAANQPKLASIAECPPLETSEEVLSLPLLSPHPEAMKTSLYSEAEIMEATGCYEKIDLLSHDAMEGAMRGMFKSAMAYIEQGETDKAEKPLLKIMAMKPVCKIKHKHLFNEFGISLRRGGMYAWSVDFYNIALELGAKMPDENIHINIARSLFRQQRYLACAQHLFEALHIAPRHWAVLRFLAWMQQLRVVPKEYLLDVKGQLARGIPPVPTTLFQDPITEEQAALELGQCAPGKAGANTSLLQA